MAELLLTEDNLGKALEVGDDIRRAISEIPEVKRHWDELVDEVVFGRVVSTLRAKAADADSADRIEYAARNPFTATSAFDVVLTLKPLGIPDRYLARFTEDENKRPIVLKLVRASEQALKEYMEDEGMAAPVFLTKEGEFSGSAFLSGFSASQIINLTRWPCVSGVKEVRTTEIRPSNMPTSLDAR